MKYFKTLLVGIAVAIVVALLAYNWHYTHWLITIPFCVVVLYIIGWVFKSVWTGIKISIEYYKKNRP